MASIVRYLPPFVDGDDEDFIPVPVSSFEDILKVEWVSSWAQYPGFKRWAYECDDFSTHSYETSGLLYAIADEDENIERALLICFVSDIALIHHLEPLKKLEVRRVSQTRLLSFIESSANTAVGYVTAIMTQLIVFPMFDIHIKLHENLVIGAIFTVISLIRGYIIRRYFNGLKFKNGS